jgi:hypothetical protein
MDLKVAGGTRDIDTWTQVREDLAGPPSLAAPARPG